MAGAAFTASVFYRDPLAALNWLRAAFGFEIATLITDAEGRLAYSEMSFRGGSLQVAAEWEGAIVGPARMRSPATVEGVNTQFLRVHLAEGIDAHCEHARAAGARVVAEPEDQFYGDRVYRALDPEGHVWTFTQPVSAFDPQAVEAKLGFRAAASLEEVDHG
ncbi:MAG: VOC family protein [Caulobacterales bacterium]|nr:VOC family protein [Caulobacterales bacterium]